MIKILYTFIISPLLHFIFWILSFTNPKIKKGFEIRQGGAWLKPFDKESKPLVWFHVASGELEYAKPVMRELKKRHACKILVTHFSPSVLSSLQKTPEIDLYVPMPWDTPWHWKEFLNHYKPNLLAISRTDTWPQMVWQTEKFGIPRLLFAATLSSHSGRVASFFGRHFYDFVLGALTHISCVSDDDKANFERVNSDLNISVDGDTRFDQVIYRLSENRPIAKLWSKKILVCGSTWPEDEVVILKSLTSIVGMGVKCIIAPHEPTSNHLDPIEKKLHSLGIGFLRYSNLNQQKSEADSSKASDNSQMIPPVIIVDKVGVLADLYRVATWAFVGGSFKKSVHSVMEPLASGCQTLVGPYHHTSREALAAIELKLAHEIHDSDDFVGFFKKHQADSDQLIASQKEKISDFVKSRSNVSPIVANWIIDKI